MLHTVFNRYTCKPNNAPLVMFHWYYAAFSEPSGNKKQTNKQTKKGGGGGELFVLTLMTTFHTARAAGLSSGGYSVGYPRFQVLSGAKLFTWWQQ